MKLTRRVVVQAFSACNPRGRRAWGTTKSRVALSSSEPKRILHTNSAVHPHVPHAPHVPAVSEPPERTGDQRQSETSGLQTARRRTTHGNKISRKRTHGLRQKKPLLPDPFPTLFSCPGALPSSSSTLAANDARARPHARLERSCGVASLIVARPSRVRARITLLGLSPSMP